MAERRARAAEPILAIEDLHVYYGQAHALQGVSLRLDAGALAVVGRNGMGKTTLCNAVIGLVPPARGRVRLRGRDLLGLPPHAIVQAGIGYVPQGRRVWPSLTVDEHLRLAARRLRGPWTVARVYDAFPRLAERRGNGGAQLSGGEQQMLAIARALLGNPRLLVMDEPTEGLAPAIVEQVEDILRDIVEDGESAVLLVEQNIGVATTVAAQAAIMVNGRIARVLPAAELARDHRVQQRFLGVGDGEDEEPPETPPAEQPAAVYRVRRGEAAEDLVAPSQAGAPGPPITRWSQSNPLADRSQPPRQSAEPPRQAAPSEPEEPPPAVVQIPIGAAVGRVAYIAGTFDTKGRELNFLKGCLEKLGLRTATVDLSTAGKPSTATIGPAEVARCHPRGSSAVFTGDRGSAVAAMAEAFERFITSRRDLGGIIAAGGSGATALATPAMRRLAVGVPKVMVSTVASGDVKRYVGPADICMIHSVTDVAGINRISEQVLSNAAHALAGMIAHRVTQPRAVKQAIGLTMFGVTTPCVQAVVRALEAEYDCLVFHATGTGGQAMEKLADSGLLAGIIDVSTTEIADLLMGGVMSAGEDRLGAAIRTRLPYVGSLGALDMVNFGPRDTVPERYRARTLYQHNPQVTLMRTTADECAAIGRWIAAKLNQCQGPVRFLVPEAGLSLLDAPGKAFHDPDADRALFAALEREFRPSTNRRLERLPHNVNDPPFAEALVRAFREIANAAGTRRAAG